jgi:hypothetical protein
MRLSRLVTISSGVPYHLQRYRARMPTQTPRYLALPIPSLTPHLDQSTLYIGHASVSHYVLLVLLALEDVPYRVTFLISKVLQ